MIMYYYDTNTIMYLALLSKSRSEQLGAIPRLHDQLSDRGQDTFQHILDNEAPQCVTSYLNNKQITFQLVPSNAHRRNAAERAISTWKNFLLNFTQLIPLFRCTCGIMISRNTTILSI